MRRRLLLIGMLSLGGCVLAQEPLEEVGRKQDSLLSHSAFKTCDQDGLASRVSEDFECINETGAWQRGAIAKFTHLWLVAEGRWKLKREYSYDHRYSGDHAVP